jgi:endonuclease YncB( thermonuclease family)
MIRKFFPVLALLLLFSGCVTEVYDSEGRPMGRASLDRELVVDDSGRIIGRPTTLRPLTTIIINGNTPTEREIRLLGVEGPREREAPNTYAKCRQWLQAFVANENEIFIRPAVGTNLNNYVIYGSVYLYARGPDGGIMPGGYVSIIEAMLSNGFVRIRDIREFEEGAVRERMRNAEALARREREGLWSNNP